GFSWTARMETAMWFAVRYGLQDPAVYRARVRAKSVLAYMNRRDEEEFIVLPSKAVRVELDLKALPSGVGYEKFLSALEPGPRQLDLVCSPKTGPVEI
ncbi:MAG TPA: hypothetical protein VHM88_01610, partial [Candidatus Acidoferrales bacterium]|nr:hypothetical protein [Candidatus Acidoferrales bacterium]